MFPRADPVAKLLLPGQSLGLVQGWEGAQETWAAWAMHVKWLREL